MSKQTAIEWLIEHVKSTEWQDMYIWHKEEVFKEAKKMFKKQIIDAHMIGDSTYTVGGAYHSAAEKYYKENYENESKP